VKETAANHRAQWMDDQGYSVGCIRFVENICPGRISAGQIFLQFCVLYLFNGFYYLDIKSLAFKSSYRKRYFTQAGYLMPEVGT